MPDDTIWAPVSDCVDPALHFSIAGAGNFSFLLKLVWDGFSFTEIQQETEGAPSVFTSGVEKQHRPFPLDLHYRLLLTF